MTANEEHRKEIEWAVELLAVAIKDRVTAQANEADCKRKLAKALWAALPDVLVQGAAP